MVDFNTLNKQQLREAMRNAGLSYAGLNVEGMRNALAAHAGMQQESDLDLGAVVAAAADAQYPAEVVQDVEAVVDADPHAASNALIAQVEQEVAPAVQVAPAQRNTSKGVKIEKDRVQRNGVKQPSAGTLCRAVWDELDRAVAAGTPHTAKSIKAHAVQVGFNTNNASIEFYNWRKFNGISGRSK